MDAVLQQTFDQQEEAAHLKDVAGDEAHSGRTLPTLRTQLVSFAQRYEELLQRNILLLRTLLGEVHRHRKHEARMLRCIFAPLKAELVALIKTAREVGAVRPEVEPQIAADVFASACFVDVLRRSLHSEPEYSADEHMAAAVEIFIRGIGP